MPRWIVGRKGRLFDTRLARQIIRQPHVALLDALGMMSPPRLQVQPRILGVLRLVQTIKRTRDVQVTVDSFTLDDLEIVTEGGFFVCVERVGDCVSVLFGVAAVT